MNDTPETPPSPEPQPPAAAPADSTAAHPTPAYPTPTGDPYARPGVNYGPPVATAARSSGGRRFPIWARITSGVVAGLVLLGIGFGGGILTASALGHFGGPGAGRGTAQGPGFGKFHGPGGSGGGPGQNGQHPHPFGQSQGGTGTGS